MLVLLCFKDLRERLEAFLAVVVEVFDQAFLLDNFRHVLAQSHTGTLILRQSNIALDDVFQKPCRRWLIIELCDHHVVQHRRNGKEPLGGLA